MAELAVVEGVSASARQIPARTQLFAVAWLRWRIFVNSLFRRRPKKAGQAVGLAFLIILRIIVWPIMALTAIGPVVGSGFFAWMAIARNHPESLAPLFAGITLLWLFVSVNGQSVAAATANFDPSSLVRFPVRFGRYMVLRTLIGLLTPSTIVGCLALLAATVGIAVAKPALALPACVALAVYAAMNVLLMRMMDAWLERWLANRRFREVFTALMALVAVGIQFLNFQRNPAHAYGARASLLMSLLHNSGSSLNWLPPGFAAHVILPGAPPLRTAAEFAGLIACTVLFAAGYGIRLHKQFLGEYLSEGTGQRKMRINRGRAQWPAQPAGSFALPMPPQPDRPVFPPIVAACLRKEWLILRSSGVQLINLLTPLIFVVILNRAVFFRHSDYFLPGAIAYVLFGVLASLYNIFGADGFGVQVYLLAPVRMRDVIVAKNLMSLSMIAGEAGLAWVLVSYLSRALIPISTQISTGLWTVFVIGANLTLGTVRSIQAPLRFIPGQARQQRGTPTNRTSGLLILLVLFGSVALQVPVIIASRYFNEPWLGVMIFGPLAAAAMSAYALLLLNAEKLVLARRDVFAEELCKS
jgi:ABC-2 type transport system permease protein